MSETEKKFSGKKSEEHEYAEKLLKAATSSASFREITSKIVQLSKANEAENLSITQGSVFENNTDDLNFDPSSDKFSSFTEMLWHNSRKNISKKKPLEEITEIPTAAPIEEIIEDHIKLIEEVDKISKEEENKVKVITKVVKLTQTQKKKKVKKKKKKKDTDASLTFTEKFLKIGKKKKKKKSKIKEAIDSQFNEPDFSNEKYFEVDKKVENQLDNFSESYTKFKEDNKGGFFKSFKRGFKKSFNKKLDSYLNKFANGFNFLFSKALTPFSPAFDKLLFKMTPMVNKIFKKEFEVKEKLFSETFLDNKK
jgi:hypothetical protein